MTGHLIHIGYPRAASTFLQSWFAQHPQLAYAEGGIAGFSSVYAMARDWASGGSRPLYRVTSYEALATPHSNAGEIMVDYDALNCNLMSEAQTKVCDLLAALFPGARVLIVTRGFRAMMLSIYSQYIRTGGTESLATLWATTAMRPTLDYNFLIGLYRRAFGEEKVIILPYELLRDDAGGFLGEIARRLGLATIGTPPGRLNPSLTLTELAWYPRLARRARSLSLGRWGRRRAWELYVHAVYANQLRVPIALLQRLRPIPPVTDAALTAELMEGFRGFATILRDEPLYRAYARDYFLE